MEIRNAYYSCSDNTLVDCEINHPDFGWIPTTVDVNNDDRPDLVQQVSILQDIAPFVAPAGPSTEDLAEEVRIERDRLLSETDWYVTRLVETGIQIPEDITTYRNLLRAIPEQASFPSIIDWPVFPSP